MGHLARLSAGWWPLGENSWVEDGEATRDGAAVSCLSSRDPDLLGTASAQLGTSDGEPSKSYD